MKSAKPKDREIDYDAIGTDESSVSVAPDDVHAAIDAGLGLKPISIRLPENLLEELKIIAEYHGVGYQPLIRKMLQRFAAAEWKQIAIELFSEKKADLEEQKKSA